MIKVVVELGKVIFCMAISKTPFWAIIYNTLDFAYYINEILLFLLLDASCSGLDVEKHRRVPCKVKRNVIAQIAIRRIDADCERFPLLD